VFFFCYGSGDSENQSDKGPLEAGMAQAAGLLEVGLDHGRLGKVEDRICDVLEVCLLVELF